MAGKHAKVTAWRVGRGTPLVTAALGIVSWAAIALVLIFVSGAPQTVDGIGTWAQVRPDASGSSARDGTPSSGAGAESPAAPTSPTSPSTATRRSAATTPSSSNATAEPADEPTGREPAHGTDPPGNGDGRDRAQGPGRKH